MRFQFCRTLEQLSQHIEALVFASEHPIKREEIKACLEEVLAITIEEEELEAGIQAVREKFSQPELAIEMLDIAGGLQFMTKPIYHHTVSVHLKQTTRKRLSHAALEVLAVVAYKQPISKSEIEKIRGVNCDYAMQKLLEKELVQIAGRSEGPGKPLLYGTSEKFMQYLGLKSLEDLPKPKDFPTPDSEIGEAAPVDEEVTYHHQGEQTEAPSEMVHEPGEVAINVVLEEVFPELDEVDIMPGEALEPEEVFPEAENQEVSDTGEGDDLENNQQEELLDEAVVPTEGNESTDTPNNHPE